MGVYVLSPSCVLAYSPWRFYDPVGIDEPSSVPSTPSRPPKNESRSVAQGLLLLMNLKVLNTRI